MPVKRHRINCGRSLCSRAATLVLAFAILFLPSFLIVKLLARQLGGRTRRHAMLGPFDRALGFAGRDPGWGPPA